MKRSVGDNEIIQKKDERIHGQELPGEEEKKMKEAAIPGALAVKRA